MKAHFEGCDMLIVELEGDVFDKSEGFVKIGRLNSAIAKAKGANNLLDSERKIFPRINAAVQLGKLKPLDPETLTPLSNSDYGTGIVTFAELVEWGQATKLFDFRRAQFTVKHIDGISTMNLAAYEEYQQALEARRSMGRYSLEEAAQFVANNSNANARSIFTKLKKSAETGELTIHWPGSDEVYKPKPGNPLSMNHTGLRGFEEAYWSDLNAWLDINELRLDCRFPEPDALAPAPKVAARLPVATQQNDAILNWLKSKKYDPLKLPVPPSGKAGVKKLCRDEICKNHKPLFSSLHVFNTAWDRLRANTAIRDAQ